MGCGEEFLGKREVVPGERQSPEAAGGIVDSTRSGAKTRRHGRTGSREVVRTIAIPRFQADRTGCALESACCEPDASVRRAQCDGYAARFGTEQEQRSRTLHCTLRSSGNR